MENHVLTAQTHCPSIHSELDSSRIVKDILALYGVKEAGIDLLQKSVYVRFDADQISKNEIRDALTFLGCDFDIVWEHS